MPATTDTHPELREVVGELLARRWSPQQIARHLRRKFPHQASVRLCHESIYQALYKAGSTLVRPATVPSPRPSLLRTGRDHREAHQRIDRRRPRFEQLMLSVHQRPFPPDDRSETGYWEGDRIVGSQQGSVIGTLIERADPPHPTVAPALPGRRRYAGPSATGWPTCRRRCFDPSTGTKA